MKPQKRDDTMSMQSLRTTNEIDNIVQAMRKPANWTRLTASTAEIAITATEKYAELQGHLTDRATENDGSIDAWGWHSGDDSDSELIWRVRIRITEAK